MLSVALRLAERSAQRLEAEARQPQPARTAALTEASLASRALVVGLALAPSEEPERPALAWVEAP